MASDLYDNDFADEFKRLLEKTSVSCYKIAMYSGVGQDYLSRLKSGKKANPSPRTITQICLAIAHFSSKATLGDFEILFNSVGRSLLVKH